MNEVKDMRAEYDFSNARKNPYAKKLKKQNNPSGSPVRATGSTEN